MRKFLHLLVILSATLALSQGVGGSAGVGGKAGLGGGPSACLTFAQVDVLITMLGTSTGTAVTTTNLATGTEIAANYASWGAASAAQTFGVSQVSLPGGIPVRNGTTHGCGFATQALAHNANTNFSVSSITITGHGNVHVVQGWIVNIPPTNSSGQFFDLVSQVGQIIPQNFILQLNPGNSGLACAAYAIEIEGTQPTTQHSSCITGLTPGGTIFFSMLTNLANTGVTCNGTSPPCAALAVYTNSGCTFTQVGSTVSLGGAGFTADTYDHINLGNNEQGTFNGTMSFQNIMDDYTNHAFQNLCH